MNKEDIDFKKLTPISDLDDIEGSRFFIYKSALDYAFCDENKDIKNIALSGPYGSGKTSIIETYLNVITKNNEIKLKKDDFLRVSVANFNTKLYEIGIDDDKPNTRTANYILEKKILNQIVHKIDFKKIKYTYFNIKRIDEKKVSQQSIFIVAYMFLIFLMTKLTFESNIILYIITVCAVIALSFIFIYNSLLVLKYNYSISKIKIAKNNESVAIEKIIDSDSYFDNNLTEILYLLENSNKKVVIFEDIDRFNVDGIFQQLREINNLLNSRLEEEVGIKFIYLVSDNIFKGNDRTKFFDFIIPVVPFISSANSIEILQKSFTEKDGVQISPKLLREISYFVDDMRLLKNIVNEFFIYNNLINITNLNTTKLLAIVVYKNLVPSDYYKLQYNDGILYKTVKKFDEIYVESLMKINNALELLERKQFVTNFNMMDDEYTQKQESIVRTLFRDKVYKVEPDITINVHNFSKYALNDKYGFEIQDFIIEEIIADCDDEKMLLIPTLVLNGYIDESYSEYMNYFHGSTMSIDEKKFLRSLDEKKTINDNEIEYNFNNIIDSIKEEHFENSTATVFVSFALYLTQNYEYNNNTIFLKKIIGIAKEHNDIDFITRLKNKIIDESRLEKDELYKHYALDVIFEFVFDIWPQYYSEITKISKNDKSIEIKIVSILLNVNDAKKLTKLVFENNLVNFISSNDETIVNSILNVKDEDEFNIILERYEKLGVKFKKINKIIEIDKKIGNIKLLEEVCNRNLYEINYENLENILRVKYKIYKINTGNLYDLIKSKTDEIIYQNVSNNINQYITNINSYKNKDKLFDVKVFKETEDNVLEILENERLSLDEFVIYTKNLETKIGVVPTSISIEKLKYLFINNNFRSYLLACVEYYYCIGNVFDNLLLDIINDKMTFKDNTEFSVNEKNKVLEFLNDIINVNVIDSEVREKALVKILEFDEIDKNKALEYFKILDKTNLLSLFEKKSGIVNRRDIIEVEIVKILRNRGWLVNPKKDK